LLANRDSPITPTSSKRLLASASVSAGNDREASAMVRQMINIHRADDVGVHARMGADEPHDGAYLVPQAAD
jgi:hypothetical protein